MHVKDKQTETEIYLSIVIRTRNEAQSLKQVFEALHAQRCSFKWEIIIVDNESEDNTVQLCRQYNACIVLIRRDKFTYGRALNLGISNAKGQLVLICSAHTVPVGSYFFESVVIPFKDPRTAAVRCIGSSDNQQIREWYTARDIQYGSPEEQKMMEEGEEWIRDYPSATCCVIRRSVWEQIPYDEQVEFMEDKLWASQVLSKGFKIRCRSDAIFIHLRRRGRLNRTTRHWHTRFSETPIRLSFAGTPLYQSCVD